MNQLFVNGKIKSTFFVILMLSVSILSGCVSDEGVITQVDNNENNNGENETANNTGNETQIIQEMKLQIIQEMKLQIIQEMKLQIIQEMKLQKIRYHYRINV